MDAATRKKFLSNRGFVLFSILAIIIILIAIFAPVLSGGIDPTAGDLRDAIMAPDAAHICGTDKMGRDIYSRVLYGARISLVSTFILVALVFVIGTALGVVSGYFGGWVDAVIMRLADMMIAFPGLVLAIAVAGMLGASMRNAIIAIAIVTWPKYARMARSLVLKIRHTDYVYAAIVTGSSTWRMLWKYMLPNTITTLVITAATDIGGMMMELSALSFLGFGAQPPTPEWGAMLNEGRDFMQSAPWMMIYPGFAIFITVVVFNMLGDNLRDILDPREE
ncbi:MAG: ABC transporter permease [Schwartzia succinivorans]|jgi:ABC-type dipeptide/oligopeptide/nickel transport system permease subunit|nr:ABC transporter permease [Schwartzia succinivorans]